MTERRHMSPCLTLLQRLNRLSGHRTTVNDSHKLKELKKIILTSKEYDEESAKEWMNMIINERKEKEEIAERRRQDEIQIAEQKRQEEIAERRRQEEIELRKQEYEERKRKDEMEFELQKIHLGAEDDWSKLNSPDDLVGKLDVYDTLRSTFRSKQPRKEWHYDKQNSFKDDSAFTTNEKKKQYGITYNDRGEPKCFHCSNFGHIARSCSLPKSVLTCREGNETVHKIINCVAKKTNHANEESLSVRLVGENSGESNSFLKKAKLNNCDNVQALIDTESSCCLLKTLVAQKLKLKFERAVNKIYGFGNQKMPALTSIERIKADIEVDNVKAENISIYVVPDDAQSVDLIIGRTWLHLPHIAYTKIGEIVHIGYREDELYRNFPIDEKVNPVCLERLETAQSESESLQIKDTFQQNMMCNLADDLKMVTNELRLLQGDIKNFKEERQSLLLQIQEKNNNADNVKSNNDFLVTRNSYYDKNKSGKVSLRKGDIVAVRRKPNTTDESKKTQPRYRGPMVVTEVRPSDTYRISQLVPRKGRSYVTIVHVSKLKAWRNWNEDDDDDSSTNSHNEPEMQRSKRTVRKPLRYGDFMPVR
ncbi:hypothetical protein AVEN_218457-1 [Araneus ventricosus]|uniref:CCHC-type domain-containing protein n=1 Tax=Araneus ventricosus TaxID=182803 RepID=A0A4Y2UE90_ARAVE|nr:hypothetical protein AVEN_218457-1 [Araneus ventricosus]